MSNIGLIIEERFIYWNFVASEKEKPEEARRRANRQFEMVPEEKGNVPLPG